MGICYSTQRIILVEVLRHRAQRLHNISAAFRWNEPDLVTGYKEFVPPGTRLGCENSDGGVRRVHDLKVVQLIVEHEVVDHVGK